MPTQTVLLKIDADASGLIASTEQSKKALGGLSAATNQVGNVAGQSTVGFDKLSKGIIKMPRANIFNILNSEMLMLTASTNSGAGSMLAMRGAMALTQRTAILAGGQWIALAATLVVLGGSLLLSKLKTEEHSKSFLDFQKKTKEADEELRKFNKDLEHFKDVGTYAGGSLSDITVKSENLVGSLNDLIDTWAKGNSAGIDFFKTTSAEVDVYSALGEGISKADKVGTDWNKTESDNLIILKAKDTLVKNESIPNLQALADNYKKLYLDIEKTSLYLKGEKSAIQTHIDAYKNWKDATEQVRVAKDKLLQKAEEEKTKEQELNQVFLNQIILKRELEKLAKKGLSLKVEGKASPADDLKKMREEADKARDAITNVSSQIGDAFANMMMGVKTSWGDMLKSMVKQMIASAIMKLLKMLLSSIPGAGGVLSFMGFQHGTPYVPETGVYMLHKGEAVVPAHRNISYVRNYNTGGSTTNYYLLNLDPDKLTRRSIVPAIEKMIQNRQTRLVMS